MTNHEVEEAADLAAIRARHSRLAEQARLVQEARIRRAEALRLEKLEAQSCVAGFCHCLGFFRGSDHCQCCGCEELEATCAHVCDGVGCTLEHDENGRVI